MKYALILFITFLLVTACGNDEPKEYYNLESEMDEIGGMLDEYDVVILGEPTHHSVEISKLFSELSLYLNDNYDFDTYAMEFGREHFDFYLNYFESQSHTEDFPKRNFITAVHHNTEFDEVIQRSLNSEDEFQLEGISRISAGPMDREVTHEEFIADDLSNFSNVNDEFLEAEQNIKQQIVSMVYDYEEIDYEFMDEMQAVYEEIYSSDYFNDLDTMSQNYIETRIDFLENTLSEDYLGDLKIEDSREEYYARRGQDMYENIETLIENGHKVVVQMHNAHTTKQLGEISSHIEVLDLRYKALKNSVGNLLEESDINTFHIATIFNEGEDIFPEEYGYRGDTVPRKTRGSDLENRISEYELDYALVNLHETDWADEEYSTYYEGLPSQRLSMVPIEQYDGILYIDYLEE